MEINLDITESNRQEVAKILNRLLSDEFVLYTKTLNYHWNVKGMVFDNFHKLFERQYLELFDIIDEVAERIRALDNRSFGTLNEFIKNTTLQEDEAVPSAREMIAHLLTDHETIIRALRKDLEIVYEQYGDMGTSNFLTDLLEKHEKTAWMLRATLQE